MSRQLFQHHATVGYHFIPGLKTRVAHETGGYLLRANDTGFRSNHPFTAAKPEGTFRVLLFGDSFTAGDGVRNKHRYSDLLPGLLGTSPERPVEVYNFGLSGTGTDQQRLIYEQFARDLPCDLIVLGVFVENLRRVNARYRIYADASGTQRVYPKPYYVLDDGALTLKGVPVPPQPLSMHTLPPEEREAVDQGGRHVWLRRAVNALGPRVKDAAQRMTRYQPLPGYDRADHPDWLLMRAILEGWIAEAHAPVVVCPIPLYQYVEETADPEPTRARFRELCAATGATLCDPLDHLRGVPKIERRGYRFETDIHPTPAGHRALAEALADTIRPLREAR